MIPTYSKSICIDYKNVLLCGGLSVYNIKNSKSLSNVYKINLLKKTVTEITPMCKARSRFGITYLNGFYYVIGGVDQNKGLIYCEKFSIDDRF